MQLGEILKNKREDACMTQRQISEQIFVSRQTVSNWETGKSYPDLETLVLLSEIYDVSIDFLLNGDKNLVNEIKKKNTFKLKLLSIALLCLLAFGMTFYFSNEFAIQIDIVNVEKDSYVLKQSMFGKGNKFFVFDSKGKLLGVSQVVDGRPTIEIFKTKPTN